MALSDASLPATVPVAFRAIADTLAPSRAYRCDANDPKRSLSRCQRRCSVARDRVRRREFITLVVGAAIAPPVPVIAKQPDRVPRVGVLLAIAESDPEGHARVTAFEQGLQELGWTAGRNVRIDYRSPTGANSVFATAVRNEHSDGAILSRRDKQLAVAGLADEEIGAGDLGAHFPIDELL